MSWPPPRPSADHVESRPWDPRSPHDPALERDSARLVYVVIDEVIGGWVGLSISSWPNADERGRLRFDTPIGPLEVGTTRKVLGTFLASARGRSPTRPAEIRVGTVFAARVRSGSGGDFVSEWCRRPVEDLDRLSEVGEWLADPTDITSEARKVAKLAYYGAVLPVVPEEFEATWNWEELKD